MLRVEEAGNALHLDVFTGPNGERATMPERSHSRMQPVNGSLFKQNGLI